MTEVQPNKPAHEPGRPVPKPQDQEERDFDAPEIVSGIIGGLANAIWVLRAPLVVAVLAMVMFSVPPQMVEVYVTLTQSMLADETYVFGTAQVVLALISVIGLCVILWNIGRDLSLIDRSAHPDLGRRTTHGVILRNLPGFLATLPLFGLAYGLYDASNKMSTYAGFLPDISEQPAAAAGDNYGISQSISVLQQKAGDVPSTWRNDFNEIISEIDKALEPTKDLFSSLLTGSMICLALGLTLLLYGLWRANTKLDKFHTLTPNIVGSVPGVVTAFLVTIAFIAFFAMQSASAGGTIGFDVTAISRFLGAIVILSVFLMCFAIFVSTLTRTYDKYWIPVISILLIIAVVGSYLNSNDNHVVRLIDTPAAPKLASEEPASFQPPTRVPRLDEAFSSWLKERPGLDSYNGEPYPVYILAAQGGGLYSANLAAITLARLYDRCAQLKDHLFAISGVSGGGVGAGLVTALLQASEKTGRTQQSSCDPSLPEPGWLETQVKDYLAEDFLSPLAGSALFPDVLQRFIPYPPIGFFDRARAFEASLEQTFPKMLVDPNPMQVPFLSTWQADGSTPMLVLNSTLVEGGRQVVIAPVAFGVTSELRSVYEPSIDSGENPCPVPSPNGSCYIPLIDENQDLPFSTALGLSARYPIVMPAGTLINDNVRSRLVDGGYFENSGIETALSIIRDIEGTICPRDAGDPGTCTITDAETRAQRRLQFKLIILTEDYKLQYVSEGLNEILSPVRALYRTRLERGQLARQRATTSRNDVHIIRIDHELFPLPLGWQFSSPTQGLIGAQIAESAPCLSGLAVETIRVHLEQEAQNPDSDFAKIDTEKMNRLVALVNDNRCNLAAILTAISKKPAARPVTPPANVPPASNGAPATVKQNPQ